MTTSTTQAYSSTRTENPLQQIQETENEAKNIVDKTEKDGEKKYEKARQEIDEKCSVKLEKKREEENKGLRKYTENKKLECKERLHDVENVIATVTRIGQNNLNKGVTFILEKFDEYLSGKLQ